MKISKLNGTYNDYKVEMSFGQLTALRNALAAEHADPLADELFAELTWYLDNIPGPGESEDDLKAQEQAADSGLAAPDAAQKPLKPKADDLLPAPGAEEGGEELPGAAGPGAEAPPEEAPPEEAPPEEAPPEESPTTGETPPEEAPPGPEGEESEADRRLPPPPRE